MATNTAPNFNRAALYFLAILVVALFIGAIAKVAIGEKAQGHAQARPASGAAIVTVNRERD